MPVVLIKTRKVLGEILKIKAIWGSLREPHIIISSIFYPGQQKRVVFKRQV